MPYRPRDWSPIHLESVVYVPPAGGHARSAVVLTPDARPGHHRIGLGRHVFDADARDIYPFPDWRDERAMRELEQSEHIDPPEAA